MTLDEQILKCIRGSSSRVDDTEAIRIQLKNTHAKQHSFHSCRRCLLTRSLSWRQRIVTVASRSVKRRPIVRSNAMTVISSNGLQYPSEGRGRIGRPAGRAVRSIILTVGGNTGCRSKSFHARREFWNATRTLVNDVRIM